MMRLNYVNKGTAGLRPLHEKFVDLKLYIVLWSACFHWRSVTHSVLIRLPLLTAYTRMAICPFGFGSQHEKTGRAFRFPPKERKTFNSENSR